MYEHSELILFFGLRTLRTDTSKGVRTPRRQHSGASYSSLAKCQAHLGPL